MDQFADCLRDEATRYRSLADSNEDPSRREEFLSLADVCEQVAIPSKMAILVDDGTSPTVGTVDARLICGRAADL